MKRKLQRSIGKCIAQRSLALAVALTAATGAAFAEDQEKKQDYKAAAGKAEAGAQHQDKAHAFIKDALRSNQMEVEMGKLGLQNGQNSEIKQLAQLVLTDHQAALTKLQQIADQKGIKSEKAHGAHSSAASPASDTASGGPAGADKGKDKADKHAKHQAEMDALKTKSGAEFDKAFARMAVKGHKKGVAKYEKASREALDAEVKGYISETLPKLKNHLSMAQNAAKAVGVTESELTSLEREITAEDQEAAGSPAGAESNSNSLNQDNQELRQGDNKADKDSGAKDPGAATDASQPQDNSSSSTQDKPQASITTGDQGSVASSSISSSDIPADSSNSTLTLDSNLNTTSVGGPAGAESESSTSSSSPGQPSADKTEPYTPGQAQSSDNSSSLSGDAKIGNSSASADVKVDASNPSASANVDVDAKDRGITEAVDRTFEKGDGKIAGVPSKKGDNRVLGLSTDKNDGKILGVIPLPNRNKNNDVVIVEGPDSASGGPAVTATGKASSDKTITFSELPASVKQAIQAQGGSEQPQNVKKMSVYEVQVNKNGQKKTLHVTEDGKVYHQDSASAGGQSALDQGSSSQNSQSSDNSASTIGAEDKATADQK